ncbi:hypothetical protein ACT3RT_14030 [Ewingella sp. AOP9-I1-14]
MSDFDFKLFWRSLSDANRLQVATEAGTTPGYIKSHLIHKRKVPKRELMDSLHAACVAHGAVVSKEKFVGLFYE